MTPDELRALRVEMAVLCGWRLSGCWLTCGRTSIWLEPGVTELDAPSLPDYPHDIAAAWQVVEAMGARGYSFSIQSPGSHDTGDGHYKFKRWQASFWGASVFDEHTNPPLKDGVDTAPLAICLAARAALRGHNDGI